MFFAFFWSLYKCSFAFFYDNEWLLWLLVGIELIIILIPLICLFYKYCKMKKENSAFEFNQNSKTIYPFVIEEDVNSKIDTLIENEIKKSKIIY